MSIPPVRAIVRLNSLLTIALVILISACADREVPTASDDTRAQPQQLIMPASPFIAFDAGGYSGCGLRGDGVVECWGYNGNGQAPVTRTAATGLYSGVAAGYGHSCGVRADGIVECWGWNGTGGAPPIRSAATGYFIQVTVGHQSTCALRNDGAVECWGSDSWGNVDALKTAISGSFTQVAGEFRHTCALRTDGVAECWGYNDRWQQAPAERAPASGLFTQLAPGSSHTCALRDSGVIECWGHNLNGQAPETKSAALGRFTHVGSGSFHSCGVRTDGVIECWGDNVYGQAPAQRTATAGAFVAVTAGFHHTCGLRTDGAAECWGYNEYDNAPPLVVGRIKPTATFSSDAVAIAHVPFTLTLTDAQVPNHPEATAFTYAFNCGDGKFFGTASSAATVTCGGSAAFGARTVWGRVFDQDNDFTEYTSTVNVLPAALVPDGNDLTVTLIEQSTAQNAPVTLGFATVTVAGAAVLNSGPVGANTTPAAPSAESFSLGDGSLASLHDISLTASVAFSGAARVCITYPEGQFSNTDELRVLHFHDGSWSVLPNHSVDADTRTVCGETTSFSAFMVAEVAEDVRHATYTVVNQTSDYSDALTTLTGGFGAGELLDAGDITCTLATTATPNSEAGDYPITASCTSNSNYDLTIVNGTYTITKEKTATSYIGDQFNFTAGPRISSAPVQLIAQLTPESDGAGFTGNIALARVRFLIFNATNNTNVPNQTVGNVPTDAAGRAAMSVALPVGNYRVAVQIEYGNMRWTANPVGDGVVTVALGTTAKRTTGGGWIATSQSANGKASFGFTVNYKKNGAPSGNALYIFRAKDASTPSDQTIYDWVVRSNNWQNGGLTFYSDVSRATFSGAGTVQKIDPATGLADTGFASGNFNFTVDVRDGNLLNPKTSDGYTVRVLDRNNNIFHQSGPLGQPQTVGGGGVQVQSK